MASSNPKPWSRLYGTSRWERRSQLNLRMNPLCAECKRQGRTQGANLSHHINEYRESFSELEFWYGPLESLCFAHHAKIHGSIKEQKNSRQILMQAAGRWTRAIRSTTALPPSENRVMNEAEIEKKQFDVRAIIEDAITSLRMAGLTKQGALKLLMVQSAIRMDNAADVREVMASIESGLVEDGDDGLRSI